MTLVERPFEYVTGGRDPLPAALAAKRINQVTHALHDILAWVYPADTTLKQWFRAHPELGSRDRAEVSEAVYDVLRHLRRYEYDAAKTTGLVTHHLALRGLHATLPGALGQNALTDQENTWLTQCAQEDLSHLPRALRTSLPDWLDARLGELDQADALIAALNQPAPLDIRVNPLKTNREALLKSLQQEHPATAPVMTPYSPWGIRLQGHPALVHWPQFAAGTLEIQDEGSQLLALLVAPRRGETIIDFCAGAGGKSLLLGALMRATGHLYALEVSATRLAQASARIARSGVSNIVPICIKDENDARLKRFTRKAQRVLVDAPCSSLGTLRRHPDLKWRQHPETLQTLCALQTRILRAAAQCVAPGGRLVYATCSVLPEENTAQAENFLATHPDFKRVDAAALLHARCPALSLTGPYMQLRPDKHGTDAFFGAVFERRSA